MPSRPPLDGEVDDGDGRDEQRESDEARDRGARGDSPDTAESGGDDREDDDAEMGERPGSDPRRSRRS